MADYDPESPPPKSSGDAPLPKVEPPSAGFILQLFVIPMIIVTIIVMVWMMFSWLALMSSNPRELVRDLKKLNKASWQKALTLADLLRNPERDDLKTNVELATELATILQSQLEAGDMAEESVKLRMFLCRALAEFHVPDALPVLIQAARTENDLPDVDVRRTALEAIALFATNNPTVDVRGNEALMDALTAASRERTEVASEREKRADLRSTAAYVLGVVGGEGSLDRLSLLLADPYANARFNAATGLARHGDDRALPVLLEMLDPENTEATEGEKHESGQHWERLQVINTGIRSAVQLAERSESVDRGAVTTALQEIIDSPLDDFPSRVRRGIHTNARDALLTLQQEKPAAAP